MKLSIDEKIVLQIGEIAERENFEVYAVGGFVRDKILGQLCKDVDFVVVGEALKFAEICAQELCHGKIVVYQRFQTAKLPLREYEVEFVSARSERYLENSRKPVVVFADLHSDLSRRDFTINAMAVKINGSQMGEVIDHFHGLDDLKAGIIRTPLAADETYSDDPLRMLRAIRFAARLGYKIEEESFLAISKQAHRLSIISAERITDEFFKILSCKAPAAGIKMLDDSGLLDIFLPELTALKAEDSQDGSGHKNIFTHSLKVLENIATVSTDLKVRLAALFHDIGKPSVKYYKKGSGWTFHGHDDRGAKMIHSIAKRLKWPLDLSDYLSKMIRLHHRPIALSKEEVTDSGVRRFLFEGGDQVEDLMLLCRADITTANQKKQVEYLHNFDKLSLLLEQVEEKDRLRNFKPPLDGDYIMQTFQLQPGRTVGLLKQKLTDAIVNGDIPNTTESAEQFLNQLYTEICKNG